MKKRIKHSWHLSLIERLHELVRHAPLLAVAMLVGLEAQAASRLPRVVVNVAIDGLRSDLLDVFLPLYGKRGFRLLMTEGKVFSNAEYPNDNPNRASSIATLSTGAVPYDHGIVDLQWLNRSTLRHTFCVEDNACRGLNTAEHFSPRNLGVSTIADELKVATEGKALVYAFAPTGDAAVLSAGHAADGAFWLDSRTGKWAGSSYYSDALPAWVDAVNTHMLADAQSAPVDVNRIVSDMVHSCFKYTTLGNDETPDYLAVTLTALQPGREDADIYAELDGAIGSIVATTEASVGQGNALFVFTSTGTAEQAQVDLEKYRIPTGNFYINRTANLLNMMLMALYGQGNYVEAVSGNQIYLNHQLVEQKQLNMGEILDRSQELLLQSEGVKDAYSAQRLLQGAWTPAIGKIRNSYNPRLSGDIVVQIAPGWHLVNETDNYCKLVRESYINFPIIVYGLDIAPDVVETPASTASIAATIANAMRIRAPNACRSSALPVFGAAQK